MKKFSLFAFLLLSVTAFAQSKFIEVEVTDTISLKPALFRCNIYPESAEEVYAIPTDTVAVTYDNYDWVAEQEKQKNKLKELKKKLENKKYKVEPLSAEDNFINPGMYGENGCSVVIKSEAEVQMLKNFLQDDATVEVTVLKFADEVKSEEQLIKKLVDKAKSKAAVIAACSGLKVGKILEVKEGKGGSGSTFETFMMEMMKSRSRSRDKTSYTGSMSKTFVVKFAAE